MEDNCVAETSAVSVRGDRGGDIAYEVNGGVVIIYT